MTNLNQLLLRELIQKYNSLIVKDHHKDRDCQFSINREWSYGEEKGWVVVHYGYCHSEGVDGTSESFSSYGQAEEHLKNLLLAWIKEEETLDYYLLSE